jgi:anaerobic ribonucleoside-triphosphate reductase
MNIKQLKEYLKEAQSNHIAFEGVCHDCNCPVTVLVDASEKEINISGGALYKPDNKIYCKCQKCFQKDNQLRNFQPCEVYSRVVGYLRPVEQWNGAKEEEYKMRKEFIIDLK